MDVHYSSGSSRSGQQEEQGKPSWLILFLKKDFSKVCPVHVHRKNYQNKYCINCDLSFCELCMASGSHYRHDILKVYRHVYEDAVKVSDMEKYIDCTMIQPYKCNKLWVLSLKPLPHNESGSRADPESACDTCKRILSYPSVHRYCSVDCKVKAFSSKAKGMDPPFLVVRERATENDVGNAIASRHLTSKGEAEEVKRNKRKRTPQRAPFF